MNLKCVDVVRAALGEPKKQCAQELLYCCPCHEDQHASLNINVTKNVWMCGPCNAGGTAWSLAAFMAQREPSDKHGVTAWLTAHGLFSRKLIGRAIAATYDYTDEKEKVLYQVVRYVPKTFKQRQPDGESQWKWNLKGVRHVPYRLPEILKAEIVFIPEGEKDVEALRAVDLVATTNSGGAGKWRPEFGPYFTGKHVVLLPDNDEPGRKHAHQIASNLLPFAASVKLVQLPSVSEKGDITDWFALNHTKDELLALAEASPQMTVSQFAEKKQEPVLPGEPVSGMDLDLDTLIAALTPSSTKQERNQVLGLILDDTDPAERIRLLKKVSARTEIPLFDLRATLKFISSVEKPKTEPPRMSEADREEALRLHGDPDLFRRFLEDSAAMGIVGEDENRALLELAYVSRLDDDPVNINVKGESSAGKNHLACTVARMHPPEVVKEITYASAKSLLYLTESLAHKILVIMEAPGAEEAQYSLRTMESEKKLKVLVAERGPDGRIETREHTVEGPITVVQTTTQPHLHPENETRCLDIYINESEGQTRAILRQQARRAEHPEERTNIPGLMRRWQNFHRLLESKSVVVPYARDMAEIFAQKPSILLRVRRDFPRLLALIRACALLHQFQRERETRGGVEHIIANEDDYTIVREVAGPALAQMWMGATPRCRKLVEVAGGFGEEVIHLYALVEALGWSAPTVRKYAKEAVHLGCLAPQDKPGQWKFIAMVGEVPNPLPASEEIFGIVHTTP